MFRHFNEISAGRRRKGTVAFLSENGCPWLMIYHRLIWGDQQRRTCGYERFVIVRKRMKDPT